MTDLETVRACLAQIRPSALNYEEWLATGMAGKDVGLSFAEWDAWSRQDKRYRPGEMQAKWNSFKGSSTHPVGLGSLVKLCRDQGGSIETAPAHDEGRELAWDAAIGPHDGTATERPALQVVRQEWLQDLPLPPEPGKGWDGRADLAAYIRTLFSAEERVGVVTESWEQDVPDGGKRWLPKKGVSDRTAGELLETLACAKDLGEVIGDWHPQAGAWIRFNPLDGQGISDSNVTALRFALVESDDISIERQHAIYQQMELPIAALVHSGSRSLHAIVRIDAPTFAEYQKRVDFLYDACKRNGLVIDRKNRNPSRLSRLPGATRNGKRQWLVATCVGKATWAEWADWIAAQNDDLPEVECLATYRDARPTLAEPIIDGILRRGHKMLLAGPSKAGKSFMLLQLAIAIAEGREWLGWKCRRGRVLYVNLELDSRSAICRLLDLYGELGIPTEHMEDVDMWHLRGKALPMTDLAPRLIRRAAKRQYAAVIIDPIYKVITGDENAAHEMAKFCNQFDRVCAELGAAVIYCHHHSKGGQGQKHASDRASGSGVFARDPDAMLDLIELELSEARRKQVVNCWECAAMAKALDRLLPDWREDCPQDTMIVADHLAEWAIGRVGHAVVCNARAPAREAAQYASGWRVEGILREFRNFDARRFWFRWPIHVGDTDGLLADALAEGEEPPKKTRQESTAARQTEQHSDAWDAYRKAKEEVNGGPVTAKDLAVWMHDSKTGCVGISTQAARPRIDAAGFVRAPVTGEVTEQGESNT
jgi:RecA-family ATPase